MYARKGKKEELREISPSGLRCKSHLARYRNAPDGSTKYLLVVTFFL
jgi:hypothetical protein